MAKAKPGRKPRTGRPLKTIDEKKVAQLAFEGANTHEIALILGTTSDLITRRFAKLLNKQRALRRWRLKRQQTDQALHGDRTMLIWLGKQELGQVDRREIDAPRGGSPNGDRDQWEDAALLASIMEGTMRGIAPPPGVLPRAWTMHFCTTRQLELLDSEARFILLPCGRGSGKTEIALRRLVIAASRKRDWDDPRFFFTAPTNPQAIRIGWDRIGKLIPKHWLREKKRGEQFYELIFGSRIYVLGMDVPARIEGPQWDGGIMDENSDQKPGAFDLSVSPALTHRDGWCWRQGVPKRTGIGAREFRLATEDAQTGRMKDTAAFTWPASDVLSARVINNARERLDPKDFNEQFDAKWETASGVIFWAYSKDENRRPVSYDQNYRLSVACDFNVDPMCWALGHRYADRVEWFDEVRLTNTNTQSTLDVVWGRYQGHQGGWEFFGDAASRQRQTSASFTDYAIIHGDKRFWPDGKRHIFIPESNPPKADRFAACNAMFLNAEGRRRMFISPTCTALLHDIEGRTYKPGTSEPADRPGTDDGHMTDGMGYLVWRCFPIVITLDTEAKDVIMIASKATTTHR